MYFVVLCLWVCMMMQGTSQQDSEQRFYLQVTKVDEEAVGLTLERCRNAECMSGSGSDELNCMCEDRYIEAAKLRAECGDGGRSETAVRILQLQNQPERLGFCARAFARLGYTVNITSTDTSSEPSDNETDNYFTNRELEEKISNITTYAEEFWNLLDRTLVGVYLESNLQRNICKVSVAHNNIISKFGMLLNFILGCL